MNKLLAPAPTVVLRRIEPDAATIRLRRTNPTATSGGLEVRDIGVTGDGTVICWIGFRFPPRPER